MKSPILKILIVVVIIAAFMCGLIGIVFKSKVQRQRKQVATQELDNVNLLRTAIGPDLKSMAADIETLINSKELKNFVEDGKESPGLQGTLMLLNRAGFLIYGTDSKDESAFMGEDQIDKNFGNKYPNVWSQISKEESGQIYGREGLFTFSTAHPLAGQQNQGAELSDTRLKAADNYWKIVSFIPSKALNAFKRTQIRRLGFMFLFMVLFWFGAAVYSYRVLRRQ